MTDENYRDVLGASRLCDGGERSSLLDHLSRSNVRNWIVPLIAQHAAPVARCTVTGADRIAALRTFWGTLGPRPWSASHLFGANRFSVAQAHTVLHVEPYCNDTDELARTKTAQYASLFARTDSQPMVTLLDVGFDLFIADGNHTSVAALMHARTTGQEYSLPVFLVNGTTAPGFPALLRAGMPEIYGGGLVGG